MKVSELRIVLDHVPDDLDVIMATAPGSLGWHVGALDRQPPAQAQLSPDGQPIEFPAALVLVPDLDVERWEPAPTVQLRGPYRHRVELDARRANPGHTP